MAPVIDSFTPTSGSRCEPIEVVITGTGFTDVVSVSIGFYLAGVTVDSDTQITAITDGWPFASPDAVAVQVETLTEIFNSNPTPGPFTFDSDLPVLSSFSPTSGPNSTATPITISGSNFTGVAEVDVGGYPVAFTVDNDGQISAVTPDFIVDDVGYVQVFRNLCYSEALSGGPFTFGAGSPPPPAAADGCITVEVPDLLADGATADANGIVYTPTLVGGWWDSIPLTSATAEVQPRGETITVAQELGREIALEITAHSPEAGVPLGPILCFTAIETIKAAFRTVFVPSTFRVLDPFADRTLLARRVGPIKQTILGDSAVVQSSIPLLAEDPRRLPT